MAGLVFQIFPCPLPSFHICQDGQQDRHTNHPDPRNLQPFVFWAALENHQAENPDSRVPLGKLIPEMDLHPVAAQAFEALAVLQCLAQIPL